MPADSQIFLANYVDEDSSWYYIPSILDNSNLELSASISHFSKYRIKHGRYDTNTNVTWKLSSYPTNAP